MQFQLEQKAGSHDRLELLIYDFIGSSSPNSVKAADIVRQIQSRPDAKEIHVRISSSGGRIIDALAIYSALRSHKARVTTYAEGLVASAAVIVFLAGDSRLMSEGTQLMVHQATNKVNGEASDFRKAADVLDRFNAGAVAIMAERTGITREEIQKLLATETWMDTPEAISKGFATGRTSQERLVSAEMSFDLDRLSNVPEKVQKQLKAKSRTPQGSAKSMEDLVSLKSSGLQVDIRAGLDEEGETPSDFAGLVKIRK